MRQHVFILGLTFLISLSIFEAEAGINRAPDYRQQSTSQSVDNTWEKLFADLTRSDAQVRGQAFLRITEELSSDRNLEEIIHLAIQHLADTDPRGRAYSALILGATGAYHKDNMVVKQKAFHALVPFIQQEKEPWVRRALAEALGRLALAESIPLLKRMSFEPEREVSREALHALGDMGWRSPEYVDQITPFLLQELRKELSRFPDSTTSRGHAIVYALAQVDDRRALQGLTLALSHKSAGIRLVSVTALGYFAMHHRYPERGEALVSPYRQWSVSLADRNTAEALLAKALTDPDERVRKEAQSMLDHLKMQDREYATFLRMRREQQEHSKE